MNRLHGPLDWAAMSWGEQMEAAWNRPHGRVRQRAIGLAIVTGIGEDG
jgi:hypothetical protein